MKNSVVGVVYTYAEFRTVLHTSNFWVRERSYVDIVFFLQFFWNWPSVNILNHTVTKYEYFLFAVIVICLICRCFYIFFLLVVVSLCTITQLVSRSFMLVGFLIIGDWISSIHLFITYSMLILIFVKCSQYRINCRIITTHFIFNDTIRIVNFIRNGCIVVNFIVY